MKRKCVLPCVLLIVITSLAHGQRWVWKSSERSQRQLDLHRPSSSFLPTVIPPDDAAAAAASAAPAASALVSPPAAPLGLVPSASSLDPIGRPPIRQQSSFSLPLAVSPDRTRSDSFLLQSQPQEPLFFKPLPLDISKLPLESSSEEVDPLGREFHPPLSPLPFLDDAVPQDLTRSLPPRSTTNDFQIESFRGLNSKFDFLQGDSRLDIPAPRPLRQSQSFVTTPDISTLPLQGTTAVGGSERFGDHHPFPDNPTDVARFQLQHSPSGGKTMIFPKKISSFDTLINAGSDQLFGGSSDSLHLSVTPKPIRVFMDDHKSLDETPFLKSVLSANKRPSNAERLRDDLPVHRGAIKFPAKVQKFILGSDLSPIKVVPPPLFLEPLVSGSNSQISSYAFPPPLPPTGFRQESRDLPDILRADRSIAASKRSDVKDFKPVSQEFKKNFKEPKKGPRVPSYVWLWPDEGIARRNSGLLSSPSRHAL